MTADEKRRVSNSELATFRRCRRKWYLSYFRSLERDIKDYGARHTGTIVHESLRAYYPLEGDAGAEAALAALKTMRESEPVGYEGEETKEVKSSYSLAEAIIRGYIEWVEENGFDADWEIVATELPLRAPSPIAGVDLVGKVDLVGRRKNSNTLRIRDYKTVQDLTTPVKTLHLDRQMKLYHLLLKLVRPDMRVDGTEWVMLRKTKRTSTAKPPFYANYEIHHNDDELKVFWNQLFGEITTMLDAEDRLRQGETHQTVCFPNPTTTCSWDCDFLAPCGMMDDPHSDAEGLIVSNYRVHNSMSRYEAEGVAPNE
jgi:RecB family exonuclease